jgi:DNA-binding transcriptional MerR regulator
MRIGELARRTQVPVRTIRYYEEINLLSRANRTESGYRMFDEDHVRRLGFIRTARRLGFRLDQIREILDAAARDSSPCNCVREVIQQNIHSIDQRIADLQAMRAVLDTTLHRLDPQSKVASAGSICPAIESARPAEYELPLDSPVDWRV